MITARAAALTFSRCRLCSGPTRQRGWRVSTRREAAPLLPKPLLAELSDVLGRERLRRWLTEEEATTFVASLRNDAISHQDPPPQAGLTPDPGDDYLVMLARASGADYLVSGDRHLIELPDPVPPVITPRQLLDQLEPPQ